MEDRITMLKLLAGIIGHSDTMIANAVHSISDFGTDIVVLASFWIVGAPTDRPHGYGHGRYGALATDHGEGIPAQRRFPPACR
jgi:divalent metal cation (Fe/Co/Zn/Cd) transporter